MSIALAPAVFWNPLSVKQKSMVNRWLLQGNDLVYPASNWRCEYTQKRFGAWVLIPDFRIINNVAMKLVGGRYDSDVIAQELEFTETFVGPSVREQARHMRELR